MSHPFAEAASQALLHLLWQGALVAGLLAALLQATPSRAARVRYALACAAMLAMLILPALTAARSYSALTAGAGTSFGAGGSASWLTAGPVLAPSPDTRTFWSQTIAGVARHSPEIVFIWLLGVLLGSARVLFGWARLQRIVKAAEPVSAEWQALLVRLSLALRVVKPVRLLASRELEVPSAIGWLKPVVLVPLSVLSGLPSEELSLVLAHELAHIRRHDYLINLIQTAAETLLFYHPAVWWIGKVIRVERENCCDDLALQTGATPLAYARALTALETLRHNLTVTSDSYSPAHAMSALGASLPERMQRLLLPSPRCASSWSIGTTVASLVLGLSLAIPIAARALPGYATSVFPQVELSAIHPSRAVATADSLSVDELIELHQAGLTPERVRQFRAILKQGLSVDDLVELAHAGVTPESLQAFDAVFGEPLDLDQVISLHHIGATPDYVRGLGALGFTGLKPDDVIEARQMGVTVEYARGLQSAGILPHALKSVSELKALGIDAGWLEGMKRAGLTNLSLEQLQSLRSMGIDGDYIKGMKAAGLSKASPEELQRLKANGITPEYLEKLREK